MSDYTGTATRNTLVDRYAERVHHHTPGPVTVTRVRRPSSGLQTFGRAPVLRQRNRSTRSRQAITTLVATAILATSTPAMTNAQSSTYQVQPGDTLGQIALDHGVSVDELISLNNIDSSDQIVAGGELILSANDGSSGQGDVQTGHSVYVVQEGDTLGQIALDHGVSVAEIIRLNYIQSSDQIVAGIQLLIPVAQEAIEDVDEYEDENDVQVGDTVYEIQPGDTLLAIAAQHGVELQDLLAINDIEDSEQIFAGDFLIIPTSGSGTSDVSNGTSEPVETEPSEQQTPKEPVETEPSEQPAAPQPVETEASEQPAPPQTVSGKDIVEDQSHIAGLHLTARGETPGDIAARYDISVEQLLQANNLTSDDTISQGDMLRIPAASWDPSASSATAPSSETSVEASEQSESAILENMPVQQQSLPLSTEAAALSMATNYWGHQVSEWIFIENMPYHQNPHQGFRGDMNGEFGGTADYGAYAKPLASLVSNYGFVGDEFYTMGDPAELKERIDSGQPVLVWMTNQATPQESFSEWYQGERFTLVPEQSVVVAYGYDEDNIYVADPMNGQSATHSWSAFLDSSSHFDGMSMAVYPAG